MLRTVRATALASLLLVAACSGGDTDATPDTTVAASTTAAPTTTVVPPVIDSAEVQPHATNVLLATLTVATDSPARRTSAWWRATALATS